MRANLVPVIIPELEGVAAKLAAGARVADVGCGSGAALVEMAKANPRSDFHGYDSSEVAIGLGKRLIEPSFRNVRFHRATAEELPADGSFDFVLTWDCLHDMTDPAAAMRAIRSAIKPDGTWLIVDVNAKPTPEENYGHPLAAPLYSFSVLDCLAVGTAAEGGAGLGTLGLPEPLVRKMTSEAGFSRLSARDFGNPVNAFYEVRP
jgi:2-polyprenyl-3-methyl-5-hydroxy-6-metoxy-1,4-benzoquinol methylase